jgi:hypothetical protein
MRMNLLFSIHFNSIHVQVGEMRDELGVDLRIEAARVISIIGLTEDGLPFMQGPIRTLISCLESPEKRLQLVAAR